MEGNLNQFNGYGFISDSDGRHTVTYCYGWLVGWLVSGAPTFVIWHHSLIHSRDLAPLVNSVLVLVSSVKVKSIQWNC